MSCDSYIFIGHVPFAATNLYAPPYDVVLSCQCRTGSIGCSPTLWNRGYAGCCKLTSENTPSTHSGEWASLPRSKRRGVKKGVEHIVPANGAFIRPCVPAGWPPPSRCDCSPLGWILVRLVGCLSGCAAPWLARGCRRPGAQRRSPCRGR